jgi:hypothetical protein
MRTDLYIGHDGPPGSNGYCSLGNTYTGTDKQVCGGSDSQYTWGETDLEVWRLATENLAAHGTIGLAHLKTDDQDRGLFLPAPEIIRPRTDGVMTGCKG